MTLATLPISDYWGGRAGKRAGEQAGGKEGKRYLRLRSPNLLRLLRVLQQEAHDAERVGLPLGDATKLGAGALGHSLEPATSDANQVAINWQSMGRSTPWARLPWQSSGNRVAIEWQSSGNRVAIEW